MNKPVRTSTLSVHAGEQKPKLSHAVATPIVQTATYSFATSAEVREYQEAVVKPRFEYGRYGSPTERTLEEKLAELHNTEDAVVMSSGMAAVTDTLLSLLQAGDHLVISSESYRRTRNFCDLFLKKYGIRVGFAEPSAESFIRAMRPKTRAVFVEIPTNPHLYVPDVPRIAAETRKRGILLIVDATIAGPFNADPAGWGADLLVLSLTKYFAGHNDVIAGAVLGRRKLLERVREYHGTAGTLLSPQPAYLVLRGIKTLALRVEKQNRNAEQVAAFLESHSKVRRVYYPALPSHPHHAVAARILRGGGCVVSFRIKADLAGAERFLDGLRIFKIAPSLGGVESLAELVATMSFWDKSKAERKKLDIPDDLIRLSLGIEDAADLTADLGRSLQRT